MESKADIKENKIEMVNIHIDDKKDDDLSRCETPSSYSEVMKKQIIKEIYYPNIFSELKDMIKWKHLHEKIARYSEIISTILLLTSASSASLQLIYPDVKYFSMGVIVVNSITFSLNKLISSSKESGEKLRVATNKYLDGLNIKKDIPTLSI